MAALALEPARLAARIAQVQAALAALDGLPRLEGDRVRLRPPEERDIDPLFALFSDPEVMRYWSRGPMRERGEAVSYMRSIVEGFERRSLLNWMVAEAASDTMIGTCTLYDLQPAHLRAALGYALAPARQGRGLAAEAAALALDWAFGTLGLHRVEADVEPRNRASARMLERLGFRHEGTLRQRFVTDAEIQDSELYGLLAEERQAGVQYRKLEVRHSGEGRNPGC